MSAQMTREEFLAWLYTSKADIRIHPHQAKPCRCGDVNCKGWRLVPADEPAERAR